MLRRLGREPLIDAPFHIFEPNTAFRLAALVEERVEALAASQQFDFRVKVVSLRNNELLASADQEQWFVTSQAYDFAEIEWVGLKIDGLHRSRCCKAMTIPIVAVARSWVNSANLEIEHCVPKEMRSRKHSPRHSVRLSAEIGPDDGLDPRRFFDRRVPSKGGRKALQLCRQIERALSLALGECPDELLRELQVESVVPAPTTRRLLIAVSAPFLEVPEADLVGRLHAATPWLRGEIAASICRKRVPELAFAVKYQT